MYMYMLVSWGCQPWPSKYSEKKFSSTGLLTPVEPKNASRQRQRYAGEPNGVSEIGFWNYFWSGSIFEIILDKKVFLEKLPAKKVHSILIFILTCMFIYLIL